jgi:BASS family bile acid:Na+ symporter
MLFRWNQWIEHNLFWVIPLALVGGFFLFRGISSWIDLVPWLFAWITFAMALGCRASDLWAALQKPRLMFALFVAGHVVLALIGWLWGALWLGPNSDFRMGLILLAAIPFGISSILWVDQSKGNRAFTLAVVVLDTLLSPLTVPAMLKLFMQQSVEVPVAPLMSDLFWMLVVPTLVGVLVHEFNRGKVVAMTRNWLGLSVKGCFILVVMINAAAVAPQIEPFQADIPLLIPCIVTFVLCGYALGWFVSRREQREWQVAALYIGGMRNISLGLVIALPYFGPVVAFPVIVTILLQQPIATFIHRFIRK